VEYNEVNRVTTVTSRDGIGRPLSITNSVNILTRLGEALTWTGDGLLNTHTLTREDFTDSRAYAYASMTRGLTGEMLNLDATRRWTNNFTYDGGVAAGPGALTTAGAQSSSSARWTGAIDPFSRTATETNTVSHRDAYGRVNGSATILASLDGQAMPVEVLNTSDHTWSSQWRASLELTPGAHQLQASAIHPSGFFTTNSSIWFTNNTSSLTAFDSFDGAGNVTQRARTAPPIARKPSPGIPAGGSMRFPNAIPAPMDTIGSLPTIRSAEKSQPRQPSSPMG